jgi:hypothetical protein
MYTCKQVHIKTIKFQNFLVTVMLEELCEGRQGIAFFFDLFVSD